MKTCPACEGVGGSSTIMEPPDNYRGPAQYEEHVCFLCKGERELEFYCRVCEETDHDHLLTKKGYEVCPIPDQCWSCGCMPKIDIGYLGYTVTCENYDGAPDATGDCVATDGVTKADAIEAWNEKQDEAREMACSGCKRSECVCVERDQAMAEDADEARRERSEL